MAAAVRQCEECRGRSGFLAHAGRYAPRALDRRLRYPVQLSEGNALAIMKCASAIFQKRRIWHVIVQPKVRSSRVASVVRFINIRLASRAHQ